MKERGILFSAPMVRALLADTKTQTRRTATNLQGFSPHGRPEVRPHKALPIMVALWPSGHYDDSNRYGQPGDHLWVREAWRAPATFDSMPPRDLPHGTQLQYNAIGDGRDETDIEWGKLRPGMFMPRWASRITLEVVSVRVERLWEITQADVQAEGCEGSKLTYAKLWESINGKGSWDANPWVWVIEFKRVAL